MIRYAECGGMKTKDIHYNLLAGNRSVVDVYIVSDYKCPKCRAITDKLRALYNVFDGVSFKYVYFSSYIDKSALAVEAAANQDKFFEMHKLLLETSEWMSNDSIFYQMAWDLELDMDQFVLDMHSAEILKTLIRNKERIINKGINSTPTYIVNGKVIDDVYALDYLQDFIENELAQLN